MALLNSKQLLQVAVTSGDCSLSRSNNITRRVLYTQRFSFVFLTSPRISRLKEMNFHQGQNEVKKDSLGKPCLCSRQDFPATFFSTFNPVEWHNVQICYSSIKSLYLRIYSFYERLYKNYNRLVAEYISSKMIKLEYLLLLHNLICLHL